MKNSEFDDKMIEINNNFTRSKNQLLEDFANSNNDHKIGDVVCDHIGKIKITDMNTTIPFMKKYPCISYRGLELKKDGSPRKKESYRNVIQTNLK